MLQSAIMTILCRVLSVAFVVANLAAASYAKADKQPPSTHTLPDVIEIAKHSVVRVSCVLANGAGRSWGTGFFVSTNGSVLTANHVIATSPCRLVMIDLPLPSIMVGGTSISGNYSGIVATIIANDPEHDLALLKPQRNPLTPDFREPSVRVGNQEIAGKHESLPAALAVNQLRDGEQVFTSGYPLDGNILITTTGFIGSSEPIGPDLTAHRLRDAYWADMRVNHGNSGGALFSAKSGKVVGMIDAFEGVGVEVNHTSNPVIQYNSGIAYIIPALDIAEFLKKNSVLTSTGAN
jgi:S1-C subfamily serine protease